MDREFRIYLCKMYVYKCNIVMYKYMSCMSIMNIKLYCCLDDFKDIRKKLIDILL